jgi:ABC-type sugar transport system, periplasmic component
LALALTLAACSSGGATNGSTASGDSQKVTLTIANSQWLDASRGKGLWNAMLTYEKKNPNVTLKQEAIPSADFSSKITTQLGAGQGPDVLMMQDYLWATEAAAGALAPLTSVVKGAQNLNATNAGGVYKGVQTGVSWQRATYALVYNKKLLQQAGISNPPTTVSQLITDAQQVTAKTGAIGFATRSSTSDPNWYVDFNNWIYGYGGGVVKNGKVNLATSANVDAVRAFKKMYDAHILSPGDDMVTSRQRFEAGKVVFIMDSSGGTLNMALGGGIPSTDIGTAPLPFPHPGAHQQIFVAVNKASKSQSAAIAFVKWLVSAAGQQALRDASGPDTLATDVPLTASFVKANPWATTFPQLAPESKSELVPGFQTQSAAIMAPLMDAVEKVLLSGADPKNALESAQSAAVTASK